MRIQNHTNAIVTEIPTLYATVALHPQIALAEISSSDYAAVRKPGGYIMGIIKRHRRT